MRSTILSTVVAIAVIGEAAAQPPAPGAVIGSIDEAGLVAAIEATDPRIAATAARVAAARAEVVAAGARPNPSISIEREEPFLDGQGFATNYLRVNLPIDVSGRRGLQIEAADAGVQAAARDATRTTHELVLEALRVFDEAVHARLRLALVTRERDALVRAVEIARQRGQAGAASGYEVQRFELELAVHDDETRTAEAELHHARMRLAALVGQAGELDAATDLALPTTVPPVEALVALARDRGDLMAARWRGTQATRRAAAAGRGWVPTPVLTGGAMTAAFGDQTGTGYVAGLQLSVPVFDRGQAEQARAAADRKLADAEARWLERQIPVAVRTAHAALVARVEQARQLEAGPVARVDVIVSAAEVAFREGKTTVTELLDAHRAARAVRLRALELHLSVARDTRALELAIGRRL